MNASVAVIGDFETVVGYRLAGIRNCYLVKHEDDSIPIFIRAGKTAKIIIITERIMQNIKLKINSLKESEKTAIERIIDSAIVVEIPDKQGPIEKKIDPIRQLVKSAVGIEIPG